MSEYFNITNSPKIPGLRFRGLNAPDDYSNMVDIVNTCSIADDFDYAENVDDVKLYYSHLANCDPWKDILFTEVDDKAVGYSRVRFVEKTDSPGYIFMFFAYLVPEWRGKGIRESMLKWCESRIKNIAGTMPVESTKEVIMWVGEKETEWNRILQENEYKIVRYGYQMVRPNLDNIPDCPLPDGIEVRPIEPSHYRKIWEADVEASKDGWLKLKAEEEWYQSWMDHRLFQPEIFQVAWDGDRVVGAVQNFIDPEENKKFNRKRGWTENIHVGREWRGKGVAQALIARSFQVLKDKGMEEAALGVDALNPTGALHLYKKMGFIEDKTSYTYCKNLDDI